MKKIPVVLSFLFLSGCSLFYSSFDGNKKASDEDVNKSKTAGKTAAEKLKEGNIKEAQELSRKAVELNPSDTASYINLAKSLAKSKNPSDCVESLLMINDLISQNPKDKSLYLTKIEILKDCDFRLLATLGFSDRTYEDLLDADSTNQDALYYLATREHQFWLNNRNTKSQQAASDLAYKDALQYYRKLERYNPTFVPGIHGLAQLYQDSYLNYYIPDMINRAVIDYPNSYELWMDLASFYYTEARNRIQYLRKSKESFERAFAIMDSTQLSDYAEISHYLTGKDLTEFEDADNKIKAAQKFWTKSTIFYLHGFNEYELEHYTRVWYAKNHFFVATRNREGDKSDRGKFYIRYGKPDDIVSIKGANSAFDDSVTVTNFGQTNDAAIRLSEGSGFGETADALRPKENYERWFYGDYELKFIYNRNFTDFVYEEPVNRSYDLASKGNYISPKIIKRALSIESRSILDYIDSTQVRVITYFAIPINSKSAVRKEFAIRLEEGKYFHDRNYNLTTSSRSNLPVFNPEAIVDDYRDSVFAVQKTSTIVPVGDYHFSHEIWAKNSDQIFSKRIDLSVKPILPNTVTIENMELIYRPVNELTKYDDRTVPDYYHFLPVFSNKIKKGRTAKLFFKITNSSGQSSHDYLVEWSMTRLSSGFFSGILDALTQSNTGTSVEFEYLNKSKVFHDKWEIDTNGFSTGTYQITMEVLDKKTRKRDRKSYTFEIVD